MDFVTPENYSKYRAKHIDSPRGRLLIANCRSGKKIAESIVSKYRAFLSDGGSHAEVPFLEDIDHQFSDSETVVRLNQDVKGRDVFIIQALYNPTESWSVDHNYMAFFIAVRAFREWGAKHVTAVLPYLTYARQDRPNEERREATTARLMADFSAEAGVDHIISWHPHGTRTLSFYRNILFQDLQPYHLFANIFKRFIGREDVILIAPDAGASKWVTNIGRELHLNVGIASKYRPRPEEAELVELIGEFKNKSTAIVLDDMVSSGGTVYHLIQHLIEKKRIRKVHLAVSHNLCRQIAYERLNELHKNYHLQSVYVTNSIPQTSSFQELPYINIVDITEHLSLAINNTHLYLPDDIDLD